MRFFIFCQAVFMALLAYFVFSPSAQAQALVDALMVEECSSYATVIHNVAIERVDQAQLLDEITLLVSKMEDVDTLNIHLLYAGIAYAYEDLALGISPKEIRINAFTFCLQQMQINS